MTRKRNPILLFLISLIPGAGEMYLGFFKHGLSVMTISSLMLTLSGILYDPIICLVPVLWFYSFFHSNNLNSQPDEEFYSIEDDYFFHLDRLFADNAAPIRRHYKILAGLLILFGGSILWNNFSRMLYSVTYELLHLPTGISNVISRLIRDLPESVISIAIIFAGIYLIKNKKESLHSEEH